jgi:hypothetical protein
MKPQFEVVVVVAMMMMMMMMTMVSIDLQRVLHNLS